MFQIDTIEQILSSKASGNVPYARGLRALVAGTAVQNNKLVVILVDRTGYIKLIDTDLARQRQFHGSVIIRNFVKGYSCLFAKPTTVSVARNMDIPQEILTEARQALNPASASVALKDITEAKKGFLTVEGLIVAVSLIKNNSY